MEKVSARLRASLKFGTFRGICYVCLMYSSFRLRRSQVSQILLTLVLLANWRPLTWLTSFRVGQSSSCPSFLGIFQHDVTLVIFDTNGAGASLLCLLPDEVILVVFEKIGSEASSASSASSDLGLQEKLSDHLGAVFACSVVVTD